MIAWYLAKPPADRGFSRLVAALLQGQMDDVRQQDPFFWGVDTVASEICVAGCPWTKEPDILARRIQEEEMDGKTLLTFELLCSRQELMDSLGIKVARRKAALAEFIVDLRSKSSGYRQWKQDFTEKQSDSPRRPTLSSSNGAQPVHSQLVETRQAVGDTTPHEDTNGFHQLSPDTTSAHDENHPAFPNLDAGDSPIDSGRPPKKRRVALVQLDSRPLNAFPQPILTEADAVGHLATDHSSGKGAEGLLWELSHPYAYLGDGSLPIRDVKSSVASLSTRLVGLEDDAFATLLPNHLPPGRRLVVSHLTKRFLIQNGRKEALARAGYASIRSPSPSDGSGEVLDLFDLPDSFDEETLREMEIEEKEDEDAKKRQRQLYLTADRARTVLDDAINDIKTKWQDRKLAKYQKTAYKIWTGARRRGDRNNQILDAQRRSRFYDERIKKLCVEILDERWSKEASLRRQTGCLVQSIQDKLYNGWLADMLGSRTQPAKPETISKRTRPVAKRPASPVGSEELTSSDEDDFVVPDEDEFMVTDGEEYPILTNGAHVDVMDEMTQTNHDGQSSPIKAESPMSVVDLTLIRTPVKKSREKKQGNIIDLTTPSKAQATSETAVNSQVVELNGITQDTPPMKDLQDVEWIGNWTSNHWARQKDRWRLVICLLWKLTQKRRTWVFGIVKLGDQCAWEDTVQQHLDPSSESESQLEADESRMASLDITRIFMSFLEVQLCSEARIQSFRKQDVRKLKASENTRWPGFCSFIRSMESKFPDDNQIYIPEAFDTDVSAWDDAGEEGGDPATALESQTNSQTERRKEIVRNKEAVDLRAREQRRVEEQEARRAKLRVALATSGPTTSDKSRIIINESKQEDQHFIYFNEDIGKRIKDHQIDGVRFMWNQILLDADIRQGCLLAHTMGLGKTMQVITLLAAIQEASASLDLSVKGQIPEDLRRSQTLILCPAGLVDNWIDELLMWPPEGLLGALQKVEASMSVEERWTAIHNWKAGGGILVVGYSIFKGLFQADQKLEKVLTQTPNVVVADEAHQLKNPNSIVHRVCSQFRTKTRIALTGSPLANNVEEYHAMINWIAPNYLGPLSEFREIYANPIQHGLWHDSLGFEKRRALKMLQVLKETVAPKVHRATVKSCLKHDLPPKYEFVISVPPTTMQQKLYELYVAGIQTKYSVRSKGKLGQSVLFAIVNVLALICNHPHCFRAKIKNLVRDEKESAMPEGVIRDSLKEMAVPDMTDTSLSHKAALLTVILDEARKLKDKVLVFSQSIPTLNYLHELLKKQNRRVCRLDGNTMIGKRQEMIKNFNDGNQEVYLVSTTAGGVGLNIQGANRVVIFDFRWNPVNDQQAIGRAYRIGQEKTVFVYRFVVAGTFEDDLQNKAVFKMQLSSRVVDKKNPVLWSRRLGGLVHSIRESPTSDLSHFLGKDGILDQLIKLHARGGAIRSIVSTDTFEEEDPSVDLTTEERKEAATMVNLNRLRYMDPEQYQKIKEDERRQSAQHNIAPPQAPHPIATVSPPAGLSHPHVHQSMDGTSDARGPLSHFSHAPQHANTPWRLPPQGAATPAVAQETRPHNPHLYNASTAALSPMVGANTFFAANEQRPDEQRLAASHTQGPAQAHATSLDHPQPFAQPRSQAKQDFEQKLIRAVTYLQTRGMPGTSGSPVAIARNVTGAVNLCRKEKALGFLPDNAQWRLLAELLQNHRFALMAISGRLTAKYLALTSREELERRIKVLDSLSDEEFHGQQVTTLHQTLDPHNLQNIRRSSMKSPSETAQSGRAREDLQVMREAADRRQRAFRLPSWANKALSEERGRGPPAGNNGYY